VARLAWALLLLLPQEPPPKPRVLSAGHSFHVFMPKILGEIAPGHAQLDVQSIGGSRVIQHWELADEKNKAKAALRTGKVDVLTLSPIYLPDEGIANFARLALEHNPAVRLTVQAFWLPYDVYDPTRKRIEVKDRELSGEELRGRHAPYFASLDEHVRALNRGFGKDVVFVVPVGHAVIALREKIRAGLAPGLKTQGELFTDAIGHVRGPVQALTAYAHYAVIYRASPVGLPVPAVLAKENHGEPLNRLLQELAWEAVAAHPLSGVKR